MRDLHHNVKPKVALDHMGISADTITSGHVIDRQGFESVDFVIQSSTITDGDYVPIIEHGDDSVLSAAATVSGAELHGDDTVAAFAAGDDDAVKHIGYGGDKRYVRLSLQSSNTTSGGSFSAIAVMGHPHHAPNT